MTYLEKAEEFADSFFEFDDEEMDCTDPSEDVWFDNLTAEEKNEYYKNVMSIWG